MKICIAARFGEKDKVRDLYEKFQNKGHEIIVDWTIYKPAKPYGDNSDISRGYSVEDIDGARNCDIFVILTDEAGTGMYIELGAAIASNLEKGKPDIYAVGENNSCSMFYFHPSVRCVSSVEEIFELR